MQITFDPHNVQECATIARLLGTTAPAAQPETVAAQPETVAAQPETVAAQPDTAPAEPDTAPAQPETDCHGMVHDDTIHSTPASKNADGSWRAKRGQKEAYEAAIAARTAPTGMPNVVLTPTVAEDEEYPTTMQATSMPMPQPASAAPATPPAPIDYKTMAERFMAKMVHPVGLPAEYEAIYAALSIGYDDLETNQTSIARLWNYMDSVDEGNDHDQSVRHALGSV